MIRVIRTEVHAMFFRPKTMRTFSENGDSSKWCRMIGAVAGMRSLRGCFAEGERGNGRLTMHVNPGVAALPLLLELRASSANRACRQVLAAHPSRRRCGAIRRRR